MSKKFLYISTLYTENIQSAWSPAFFLFILLFDPLTPTVCTVLTVSCYLWILHLKRPYSPRNTHTHGQKSSCIPTLKTPNPFGALDFYSFILLFAPCTVLTVSCNPWSLHLKRPYSLRNTHTHGQKKFL